jgi:DNA polymerase-4
MNALNTIHHSTIWPRAIILVDMNAFFASVEQHDYPELRGRPIAITNGDVGTGIITCSYEARAYGVRTGMRLNEALIHCPHLLRVSSHPKRYAEVSSRIMKALNDITPDVEVFSVDEAFLDVTHCQKLFGPPQAIGLLARQKVFAASGLLCSIGVSGDKTTAKYAAKLHKPNGFHVIPPWETKERLENVPVRELCGIGEGIEKFLAKYGVYCCGDMAKLPISVVGKRFGDIGRRIWLMCQGADFDSLHTTVAAPKSMGHGKVMPPKTNDTHTLCTYLYHMCEKLAARLRRHAMQAQHFFIGWKSYGEWLGKKCALAHPSNDGKALFNLGKQVLSEVWYGQAVYQIQVTALDPQEAYVQPDLFITRDDKKAKLNSIIDNINARYGEFAVAPAPLLKRSSMHNVIAPAWKPYGHRQSIY